MHICLSAYLFWALFISHKNSENLNWTIWWQHQTWIQIFVLNVTNTSPHTTINSLICITHNFWKHTGKQQCLMKCLFLYKTKRPRTILSLILLKMMNSVSVLFCFLYFSSQWCSTIVQYDVRTAVCVRTLTRSITACGATPQNPASIEACVTRSCRSVHLQRSLMWGPVFLFFSLF